MTSNVHELASGFNALPADDTEIGEWFFDIRYIPFYPPYHLLFVCDPSSGRLYTEHITVDGDPLKYFPETGAEAGPPAAHALLRAFLALGVAPTEISTNEDGIARAIVEELKGLGVDLVVDVAIEKLHIITQCLFMRHFTKLKSEAGYASVDIIPPTNISFDDFPKKVNLLRALLNDDISADIQSLFLYVQQVINSEPPMDRNINETSSEVLERVNDLQRRVQNLPLDVVKEYAEGGDPHYAFDYGMRLWVGLGCTPNKHKAHKYLVHAALSPLASQFDRATAHGVLTSWYIPEGARLMRPRDAIACAYHANESAILCCKVSPPGARESPYVLRFVKEVFFPMVGGLPHIRLMCKDAKKAWDEDEARCAAIEARMNKKISFNPARYQCANPKCHIEADTGKILNQCAGKCDAGKKPHYCSKACQVVDWGHHKPYCKPGAESSVAGLSARWVRPEHLIHYKSLDPENDEASAPRSGTFKVRLPNGQTLSSATMDPETLKAAAGQIN